MHRRVLIKEYNFMKKQIVLIATIGTSPAVLSETVWALASLPKPVIPDEVVVITTVKGGENVKAAFFGKSKEWDSLKQSLHKKGHKINGKLSFGPVNESIRIPANSSRTNELADIATSEDNSLLADYYLSELRKYTERPDVQLYVSIAGGRKTMSALMLSCMSLLGRECDHVLHVLVNSPFDSVLSPQFLFPKEKVKHTTHLGKTIKSTDAKIELIDIPFVKMRGWYQDKFKESYPSYSKLVSAIQETAPEAKVLTEHEFKFDYSTGRLLVDGVDAKLNPVELVTLAIGLEVSPQNPYGILQKLSKGSSSSLNDSEWISKFKESSRFSEKEDPQNLTISKIRNEIKKKLSKNSQLKPYMKTMFPRGVSINACPNFRISTDIKKLYDLLDYDNIIGVKRK